MERDELLRRYEARGEEQDFLTAKSLYEQALAESPDDPEVHLKYGYLLECHARNQLRLAAARYERAIELNPDATKAHYQLIAARAGLLEPELPIEIYERRLAGSPNDLNSHRLLAAAYLAAHEYHNAQRVIEAGLTLAPNDAALIESRGSVRAGTGDPGGALEDWRHALELNPEISPPSIAVPSYWSAKDGWGKPWTPGAISSTGPTHGDFRWTPSGRAGTPTAPRKSCDCNGRRACLTRTVSPGSPQRGLSLLEGDGWVWSGLATGLDEVGVGAG